MKAAVLREVGKPLTIENVQINKPGPHEVLIRTAAAGVCHSDLHFVEGSYPYPLPAVLGHESAGVVEQVGSEVRTVKPGDHVITCLSAFCGHCEHCLTGHMSRCVSPETKREAGEEPRLGEAPGAMNQFLNLSSFAEQMLIHEHACVAIRKDMPLDRAALIGCSVTTGVGAVIHTSQVRPGETFLPACWRRPISEPTMARHSTPSIPNLPVTKTSCSIPSFLKASPPIRNSISATASIRPRKVSPSSCRASCRKWKN